MQFAGFPVAALDFYDDLEVDNTRSFWEAHRETYERCVRAPMTALLEALAGEFSPDGGSVTVFRPYRDVRFSKDKTPYKTHQGGFVPAGPGMGFYVEVAPRGVRVGAGCYHAEPPRLAAIREAMADERTGPVLQRTLTTLERAGFSVGGEKLKTSPRGWPADHPRIDLLRHKQVLGEKSYGFEPVIHTPEVLDLVREDWRALRPLLSWLRRATDGVPG